jgi:hypothetical protein
MTPGGTTVTGTATAGFCMVRHPAPANVCDFSISPGGNIAAQYCDSLHENVQTFSAHLTSSSPSSCQWVPSNSSGSVTGSGHVFIDQENSSCSFTSLTASCTVKYDATKQPDGTAGMYDLSMSIKFYQNTSSITHHATGEVQCP